MRVDYADADGVSDWLQRTVIEGNGPMKLGAIVVLQLTVISNRLDRIASALEGKYRGIP